MKARKFMVVSGFLGAGKTTSMIAFAEYFNQKYGKAVIIVNDLGAKNLVCIISQHREGSRIMISWISSRCQKRGHLVHFVWSDRNAGDARVRNSEADT